MTNLTTIILTYNEETNIKQCINSVKKISDRVVIIDSFSNDRTLDIAYEMGAEVLQNKFISHAKQFQFALDNSMIDTLWVLKLDADERITPIVADKIEKACVENTVTNINGIVLRFEVNFLGKKLRHGGIYPFRKMCVFKFGIGKIEDRNMDEHVYISEGKSIEIKDDCLHHDNKDLSTWIDKHNKYSDKEVLDYYAQKKSGDLRGELHRIARIRRMMKYKIYYRLPMGIRAYFYFMYRYIVKLGFLDGKEGLIFAFLQAYWYRFLIDAKIYEVSKKR